ncbi:MAG: hypothetical protein AAF527_11270 [Pseudomonadota bacterium]
MGPIFIVALWFVAGALLFIPLFGLYLLLGRFAFARSWLAKAIVFGVPATVAFGPPIGLFILMSGLIPADVEKNFEMIHGFPASETILLGRASTRAGSDFEARYVSYTLRAPNDLYELLAGTPFKLDDAARRSVDGAAPKWWRGDACDAAAVFVAPRSVDWDNRSIVSCADDGVIYASASWIY